MCVWLVFAFETNVTKVSLTISWYLFANRHTVWPDRLAKPLAEQLFQSIHALQHLLSRIHCAVLITTRIRTRNDLFTKCVTVQDNLSWRLWRSGTSSTYSSIMSTDTHGLRTTGPQIQWQCETYSGLSLYIYNQYYVHQCFSSMVNCMVAAVKCSECQVVH